VQFKMLLILNTVNDEAEVTCSGSVFKIFANQHPVFIISFHLPEIPPLPLG